MLHKLVCSYGCGYRKGGVRANVLASAAHRSYVDMMLVLAVVAQGAHTSQSVHGDVLRRLDGAAQGESQGFAQVLGLLRAMFTLLFDDRATRLEKRPSVVP